MTFDAANARASCECLVAEDSVLVIAKKTHPQEDTTQVLSLGLEVASDGAASVATSTATVANRPILGSRPNLESKSALVTFSRNPFAPYRGQQPQYREKRASESKIPHFLPPQKRSENPHFSEQCTKGKNDFETLFSRFSGFSAPVRGKWIPKTFPY